MFRPLVPILIGCLASSSVAAFAADQSGHLDLRLASQYFEVGKTYYDRGDYEKALTAFRQSYQYSRKPALLYNIGKCYESLGKLKEAIEQLELYLRNSGRTDTAINARIRNLRARLRQQQDERQRAAISTAPTTRPASSQPATAPPALARTSGAAAPPSAAITPPLATEPEERPARWMSWTGWALAGVGVASVATSFVLGAKARSKSNDVEQAYVQGRQWPEVEDGIFRDGERLEVAQIITLVTGIIAAAGGVTLLVLAPGPRETTSGVAPTRSMAPAARVVPMLGHRAIGVASAVSF